MISIELNVIFNDPFWIGIFEISYGDEYNICKVTFGSEPKDYEILEFIKRNFYKLKFNNVKFEDNKAEFQEIKKINPKRLQRQIQKKISERGLSTKSQLALQAVREENKIERKKRAKADKEKVLEMKFKLKQEKKLKKHKGH